MVIYDVCDEICSGTAMYRKHMKKILEMKKKVKLNTTRC